MGRHAVYAPLSVLFHGLYLCILGSPGTKYVMNEAMVTRASHTSGFSNSTMYEVHPSNGLLGGLRLRAKI